MSDYDDLSAGLDPERLAALAEQRIECETCGVSLPVHPEHAPYTLVHLSPVESMTSADTWTPASQSGAAPTGENYR